jgi:hypothetical protein
VRLPHALFPLLRVRRKYHKVTGLYYRRWTSNRQWPQTTFEEWDNRSNGWIQSRLFLRRDTRTSGDPQVHTRFPRALSAFDAIELARSRAHELAGETEEAREVVRTNYRTFVVECVTTMGGRYGQ